MEDMSQHTLALQESTIADSANSPTVAEPLARVTFSFHFFKITDQMTASSILSLGTEG